MRRLLKSRRVRTVQVEAVALSALARNRWTRNTLAALPDRNNLTDRLRLHPGSRRTVSQGLCNVAGENPRFPIDIGNRAGDLENAVIAPSRKPERFRGLLDQPSRILFDATVRIDPAPRHMRIAFDTMDSSKTISLHFTRGRNAIPDDRSRLGILRGAAQVGECYGADCDVHVDPVGEWT